MTVTERTAPFRERVERGVYKRKTKDGRTRYDFGYLDSDGRQRWGTAATLREARDGLADVRSKIRNGERVAPAKTTFGEYADRWVEQARLRPNTRELYKTVLRLHLRPRFGRRPIQSITVDDVAGLIAEMEKGVRFRTVDGRTEQVEGRPFAGNTIRGVLVVLGRIYATASRAGVVSSNPVRRLETGERPRVDRRRFPRVDRKAIATLIAKTPERYRVIVALSVTTGIRQGEALGLRWEDVDLRAGVLHVRWQLSRAAEIVEPKTPAAIRDVPFPTSLGGMLKEHRRKAFEAGVAKPTDFVFASETGGPLHFRNVVRRGLEKGIEAGKLPSLRWHDLRHVAASALIADGVPIAYVSRILGHSSPAVTLSIYAHEFASAQHEDRTREIMEGVYGEVLR